MTQCLYFCLILGINRVTLGGNMNLNTKILQQWGLVLENGRLSAGVNSILRKNPHMAQFIIERTSFLRYNATLRARIHCLLQGLTHQPTCEHCNKPLEMRLVGKFRFTFPTFCGQKCSSNDAGVRNKRAQTNIEKYGTTNALNLPTKD